MSRIPAAAAELLALTTLHCVEYVVAYLDTFKGRMLVRLLVLIFGSDGQVTKQAWFSLG